MTIEYKKTKELSHISSFIKETLGGYTGKKDGIGSVWEKWEEAVGEKIAENARPAAFKKDILLVHVSNSTWMQHLSFLKEDIIKKINDAVGSEAVKEIKYKIGKV